VYFGEAAWTGVDHRPQQAYDTSFHFAPMDADKADSLSGFNPNPVIDLGKPHLTGGGFIDL